MYIESTGKHEFDWLKLRAFPSLHSMSRERAWEAGHWARFAWLEGSRCQGRYCIKNTDLALLGILSIFILFYINNSEPYPIPTSHPAIFSTVRQEPDPVTAITSRGYTLVKQAPIFPGLCWRMLVDDDGDDDEKECVQHLRDNDERSKRPFALSVSAATISCTVNASDCRIE